MRDTYRIKFAGYLPGWDFLTGDHAEFRRTYKETVPTEYLPEMKGSIFCPECCAPLYRSPELQKKDSAGRDAYYAHNKAFKTECNLRTKRPDGKRYLNEEEAKQAIDNEELVIINSFMKSKPLPPTLDEPAEFTSRPVEDEKGKTTEVAIGRHNGEKFKLPSRVQSIAGLTPNFDKNLYKYFVLPGRDYAERLIDLLIDVQSVSGFENEPRLYFGRIIHTEAHGRKSLENKRTSRLEYPKSKFGFPDFSLKLNNGESIERGIGDNSVGRYVLMYGRVTKNGVGLCIENPGWGEFALLPEKYEELLPFFSEG